jgi:hypothetical protein
MYSATLRGYTFGTGQTWTWKTGPAGIGPGSYRGARVPLAGSHGSRAAGPDYANSSLLVFELQTVGTSSAEIEAAGFDLREAFAPATDDLELAVTMAAGSYVIFGRPMAGEYDLTDSAPPFLLGRARVTFEALDPRWYAATTTSVSAATLVETGGFETPMVTPLVTTTSGSTGDASVTNNGTTDAPWTATLNGPLTEPRLVLNGVTILINGTIPAGEIATVDSRTRSVIMGEQVRHWVSYVSSWWDIPPGTSTFSLRATSGTGTVLLNWRDASF